MPSITLMGVCGGAAIATTNADGGADHRCIIARAEKFGVCLRKPRKNAGEHLSLAQVGQGHSVVTGRSVRRRGDRSILHI